MKSSSTTKSVGGSHYFDSGDHIGLGFGMEKVMGNSRILIKDLGIDYTVKNFMAFLFTVNFGLISGLTWASLLKKPYPTYHVAIPHLPRSHTTFTT